jgi:hypothetical protein
MKARIGRPPIEYDDDIAREICRRAAHGEPLTLICKDDALPSYDVVYKWLREVPLFADAYARARDDSAEAGYYEIVEIERDLRAGLIDPNAARALIDSIKWRLGRIKPKVYGDRLTLAGDEDAPLHHAVSAQVAALSASDLAQIERIVGSGRGEPIESAPALPPPGGSN